MADTFSVSSPASSSVSDEELTTLGPHPDAMVLDDMEAEEEEDDEGQTGSANLRSSLKIIRDPAKTAFDMLPSGETIGAFANRHAIDRYARKVESKRERARETRMKKRKQVKSLLRRQEKTRLVYGNISGSCFSREIANGVGAH